MKDLIVYGDFTGSVHFSAEDDVFYGKIEGIHDLITFEATSVAGLKQSFADAVEDYLELCREVGKDPHKSYKGTFNIRTGPELHRAAAIASGNQSLNAFVCTAIQEKVERLDLG